MQKSVFSKKIARKTAPVKVWRPKNHEALIRAQQEFERIAEEDIEMKEAVEETERQLGDSEKKMDQEWENMKKFHMGLKGILPDEKWFEMGKRLGAFGAMLDDVLRLNETLLEQSTEGAVLEFQSGLAKKKWEELEEEAEKEKKEVEKEKKEAEKEKKEE